MSERAFYCPCDEFDMFDIENYEIEPPGRSTYCRVPMFECIERQALLFYYINFKQVILEFSFCC